MHQPSASDHSPTVEFLGVSRRWRAGILGSAAEVEALAPCSLRVAPGEVVVVTGGAGAGKSTLLMLAAGLVAPSEGTMRWSGEADPTRVRPQLIGARPWEYNFLTVRQALTFHADVLSLRDASLAPPVRFVPLMTAVGLRGQSRIRLGQLGALDRLRVVVAQALLALPRLICCEEPFAFCGPDERREGASLLRSIAGRGISLMIATRDSEVFDALELADHSLRLVGGRVHHGIGEPVTVLELSVPRPDEAMLRLADRLPSLARRGRRIRVPLAGSSPEAILALCRDAGVSVRGSRVAEEGEALPVRRRAR